jgi:hypothetical protein
MKKANHSSLSKKVRKLEKEFTKGLLKWRLKKTGQPPTEEAALEQGAERIVNEAHQAIKKSGKTILEELKQAKKEFLKAYSDENKKNKRE